MSGRSGAEEKENKNEREIRVAGGKEGERRRER